MNPAHPLVHNILLVLAKLLKKRFCALVGFPNCQSMIILNLPVKHIGFLGEMS